MIANKDFPWLRRRDQRFTLSLYRAAIPCRCLTDILLREVADFALRGKRRHDIRGSIKEAIVDDDPENP
jgi:hypothetical protein